MVVAFAVPPTLEVHLLVQTSPSKRMVTLAVIDTAWDLYYVAKSQESTFLGCFRALLDGSLFSERQMSFASSSLLRNQYTADL